MPVDAHYPTEPSYVHGARPVEIVVLDLATGCGAYDLNGAAVKGCAWFRREWLEANGLNPKYCAVVKVRGGSMAPTLPVGGSILINRLIREPESGQIFVVRTNRGIVVHRFKLGGSSQWLMESDAGPPAWPPEAYPDDAFMIGQVVWVGHTLARPPPWPPFPT